MNLASHDLEPIVLGFVEGHSATGWLLLRGDVNTVPPIPIVSFPSFPTHETNCRVQASERYVVLLLQLLYRTERCAVHHGMAKLLMPRLQD